MEVMIVHEMTEQEYCKYFWEPDKEYVDGKLLERNVGRWKHGHLQAILAEWFRSNRKEWNIQVGTEVRIKIADGRYRIPDVVILSADLEAEEIITRPPLLVIEVLSPEDSISEYSQRIADFRAMGIPHIWILDPYLGAALDMSDGRLCLVTELKIPGTDIHIPLPEVFE